MGKKLKRDKQEYKKLIINLHRNSRDLDYWFNIKKKNDANYKFTTKYRRKRNKNGHLYSMCKYGHTVRIKTFLIIHG